MLRKATDEEIIAEGSRIILPATARRPYPIVRLVISEERMETARRADSYNCMITDEFRALMADSDIVNIRTDRAHIRAYNRKLNLNLAWRTPRDVAGRIDLWDDGVRLKPYWFVLRKPEAITRHGSAGKPVGRLSKLKEEEKRAHRLKLAREYARKKRAALKVALNPDLTLRMEDFTESFQNPDAMLGPPVVVPNPQVGRTRERTRTPITIGGSPQTPTRGLKHLRRFGFRKLDADKWVAE